MNLFLNIFALKKAKAKMSRVDFFKKSLLLSVVLFPLFQVTTLWFYTGSKVDESELVLFGVGFLGGDLDPVWNHYGHLGMYLLGFVYYIIGLLSIVLGEYKSLTEYAVEFTFSGYFYIIARLIMAICIMLSVVMFALILDRFRCNRWLILLLLMCVSISPTVIKYSNYIRTDTLVALFTVCILFYAIRARNYTHMLMLALFTAAAIASKISAVTLSGVLAVTLCCLLYRREVSWLKAVSIPIICIVLIQAFSPYMDYVDLVGTLINTENASVVKSASRKYYIGFTARVLQTLDFHIQALGMWVCLLSLCSFFALFSRFKKIVAYSWLLIFFTLLPYMFGSTLRDYWFLSTYMLVSFMAIIAVVFLLEMIQQFAHKYVFRVSVISALIILISGPLLNVASGYASLLRHQMSNPITNSDAAQEWLEKNQLGVNPILIDRNYSWVYPKLYDPAYLENARDMARLFIYERGDNKFLSSVFEQYLFTKYVEKEQKITDMLVRLEGIRVDFHGDISEILAPEVCSNYSGYCYSSEIHTSNDVQLNSETDIQVVGPDPYIVYRVNITAPIDGSYIVNIDTDARSWELRYDFGKGYPETPAILRHAGDKKNVPILSSMNKPWVHKLGQGEKWRNKVRAGDKVLFVTSDGPYSRFEYLRSAVIDPKDKHEIAGLSLLNWHDKITESQVVKVFNTHLGSPIKIYNIVEFLN